jgi:hypothetical protein
VTAEINNDGGVAVDARRQRLERLLERLTEEVEVADARELPGLAREVRATLSDLDALPAARPDSPTDEVTRRREARRRKASGE